MKKIIKHGLWEDTVWLKLVISTLAILPANTWTSLRAIGILIIISIMDFGFLAVASVFTLVLLTDFIDGKVARLCREYSWWWLDPWWWLWRLGFFTKDQWLKSGIWYDPMADKIFIISYLYYFGTVLTDVLPLIIFWSLMTVELSGRAIVIPLGRHLLKKPILLPANFWGKAKFVAEAILSVLIFLAYYWPHELWEPIVLVVAVITLAMAIFSVVNYIFEFHDPWRRRQMHT